MKKAILSLGLPGSGKTTYLHENYKDDYMFISADDIRVAHPNYNPNDPDAIHEECVKLAEEKVYEIANQGLDLIMDGGGINNKYTLRIISKLKEFGYHITIVFINTPVGICLERNNDRITLGERYVPNSVIINKAFKLKKCVELLKTVSDEFIQVDHFTNEHIFADMDGVVAEYQDLPLDEYGDINFVSYEIFKNSKPVLDAINKLKALQESGKKLYILSASPNSICNKEKLDWLEKYMPFIPKNNIYFVGNKCFKNVYLRHLLNFLKLNPKDCSYIEDEHLILEKIKKLNVNAMHVSKFLANF